MSSFVELHTEELRVLRFGSDQLLTAWRRAHLVNHLPPAEVGRLSSIQWFQLLGVSRHLLTREYLKASAQFYDLDLDPGWRVVYAAEFDLQAYQLVLDVSVDCFAAADCFLRGYGKLLIKEETQWLEDLRCRLREQRTAAIQNLEDDTEKELYVRADWPRLHDWLTPYLELWFRRHKVTSTVSLNDAFQVVGAFMDGAPRASGGPSPHDLDLPAETYPATQIAQILAA